MGVSAASLSFLNFKDKIMAATDGAILTSEDQFEIQMVVAKIKLLGSMNCSEEDLEKLHPFAGLDRPVLFVQDFLGAAYLDRRDFDHAEEFYKNAAAKFKAFHIMLAIIKFVHLELEPEAGFTKADIMEEFIQGGSDELIAEVPIEELRDSLSQSKDEIVKVLINICDGCDKFIRDKTLKRCDACKNPCYCSETCEQKHWAASHKNYCADLKKLVCTFCGRVSSENLKVCCDKTKFRYCDRKCQSKDWKRGHRDVCTRKKH